jgi:hypothetical protein
LRDSNGVSKEFGIAAQMDRQMTLLDILVNHGLRLANVELHEDIPVVPGWAIEHMGISRKGGHR